MKTWRDRMWEERCRDVALDCAYDNPGDEQAALLQFQRTDVGFEDLGFGDVVEDSVAEEYIRAAEAQRVSETTNRGEHA